MKNRFLMPNVTPVCRANSVLVGAIAFLLANASARADLYWDLNQGTANTGTSATGSWNGIAVNWNSDSTGGAVGTTTAATAGTDILHFSSGTNYTSGSSVVTISGTRSADSLFFEEGTITTSGGTIAFGSGTSEINVASGRTANIGTSTATAFTGSNGLTKTGAGVLILGAVYNSGLTGTINVKAGTLVSGSSSSNQNSTNGQLISLGDTDVLSTDGATFSVNRNQNYNSAVTVNAGSSGTKRISGGPGLTAQQTPSITSAITLNDDVTLGNGSGGNIGGVALTGVITGSASRKITVDGANSFTNAQTFVNNITNATLAVTMAKIGGGNSATFLGSVDVSRGVLALTGGNALGSGNTVTVGANGGLDVQTSVTIGGLNDFSGSGGTVTSSIGNTTLTLGGSSSYAFSGVLATPLITTGTGSSAMNLTIGTGVSATNQTLSGSNSHSGITTIANGSKLIMGNANALGTNGVIRTAGTGGTTVLAGGTLDLGGQSAINEVITLNGTGTGSNGALVNNSATAASIGGGMVSSLSLGATSGLSAIPTLTVSGGGGSGATATALGLGVTAATFSISGGTTVYSAAPSVTISGGGGSGATASVVMTAGVVTGIAITNLGSGFTSAPTIAFTGGTVSAAGTNPTGSGNGSNFTLSGVQLTANGTGYTSAPTVSMSGGSGTITSNVSSVILASDSSVGGLGDITIHSKVSGAFGLSKVGGNVLTLAGENTYSGATQVLGGTLALGAAGSIDNTSGVSLGAGGTFDVSAKSGGYTVGNLSGSGTVIGALTVSTTLAIGNSPGTTTFDGDLTLGSAAVSNFEITDALFTVGTYDLAQGGIGSQTVTFGGGTLNLLFSGGSYVDDSTVQIFNFENYSGTFGTVNVTGLDIDQTATFDSLTGIVTITAVPEPGAVLLGSIGVLALLRRRR